MEAVIEKIDGVTVVELPYDKIDASCKPEFQNDVAVALSESGGKVVFDMRKVQFVDSVGIGAIVSCLKELGVSGGDLKLCHVAKPVRSLFELVRLHKLMDILNTKEEALRAFGE